MDADGVTLTQRCPLYCQHEGHSRTIIGIEQRCASGGDAPSLDHTLLVLDPSTASDALRGALASGTGWQRLLKRGMHTLRHPQFQVLFVEPGLATGSELERLKMVAARERY